MTGPRVLFVASEAWPLVKTGGLGDVAYALPRALYRCGADVRVLLPAYKGLIDAVDDARDIAMIEVPSGRRATLVECRHHAYAFPLWLLGLPGFVERAGNPYVDGAGHAWTDNAERYCDFSAAAAVLAGGAAGAGWHADVLHCNDWQSGPAAAFASVSAPSTRRVFTIHNIAYDCLFDRDTFDRLSLPAHWWSIDGGEFYHRFSMLKSGIVFADAVTTVSPRYAREIRTEAYGYGYAGILDWHADKLSGIVNGIDDEVWDPRQDVHLARHYGPDDDVLAAKAVNAQALIRALGGPASMGEGDGPLIGFVGRLVHQKGIDLLLEAMRDDAVRERARFIVIGTGEPEYERSLRELSSRFPANIACHVGYDERLAHLLEAGCDLFVMPSRFEPCGLNQMYSMRYGTLPIVRETGGLADTVVDANGSSASSGGATGFVFRDATTRALCGALHRALDAIDDESTRLRMIRTGMTRDFGWKASARQYLALYGAGNDSTE